MFCILAALILSDAVPSELDGILQENLKAVGTMLYVVTSDKSIDQVCENLEDAVVAHKFGLMATHNLRETMAKKGVSFDRDCRIFEVCNPQQAKKALELRMEVFDRLALPNLCV